MPSSLNLAPETWGRSSARCSTGTVKASWHSPRVPPLSRPPPSPSRSSGSQTSSASSTGHSRQCSSEVALPAEARYYRPHLLYPVNLPSWLRPTACCPLHGPVPCRLCDLDRVRPSARLQQLAPPACRGMCDHGQRTVWSRLHLHARSRQGGYQTCVVRRFLICAATLCVSRTAGQMDLQKHVCVP